MNYKLGEISNIFKGSTGIMKAIPGNYPMITLGEENKTHNEFQFNADAVIIPLVSSTGHGHASMKRVKYFSGKFALGNILCAVIPKDHNKVSAKYLHTYLQTFKEELLVSRMKGMANVSLSIKNIQEVEVPIPSLDVQENLVKKIESFQYQNTALQAEQSKQLKLLDDLNQAILQEAVQGKLVPQDSSEGDARDLLESIKKSKANTSQVKKSKPLPPIREEEIPFSIPKNWVWVRLGEVIEKGKTKDIHKNFDKSTNINYVDIDSIDNINFQIREIKIKKVEQLSSRARREIQKGDLIFSTVRPYLKNIALVDYNLPNFIGTTGFCVFKPLFIERKYIFYILLGNYILDFFNSKMTGFNSPSISVEIFDSVPIPLPPLAEQKRIVEAIEKERVKIAELKKEVESRQVAVENLGKAILQEAFG